MTKILLEISVILVAVGKILDFYFQGKDNERFSLAFRFLMLEEWLRKRHWREIQRRVVQTLLHLHEKLFGQRIVSFRYPLVLMLTSMVLTVFALLLAMLIIPKSELVQAGFADPATPYLETLHEFIIETTDKTQSLMPTVLINILFDALAFTISYVILRSLAKSGGIVKLLGLTGVDIVSSAIFILLTQLAMVVFQYSGHVHNVMIQHRRTTFLLTSPTALLLVSCTAALPVLIYSLGLAFIGFLRLAFKAAAFISGRLADTKSSVFTDVAVFISSVIVFSLGLLKGASLLVAGGTFFLSLLLPPALMGAILQFFKFWLDLADL